MRPQFGAFTANWWGRTFVRNLRRQLKGRLTEHKRVVDEIVSDAQLLFATRADYLPDRQARFIQGGSSLVLAAYRRLAAETGEPAEAREVVKAALDRTLAEPMKWQMRLLLWFSRDPLKSLARRSLAAAGRRVYGSTMEFDEERTADSYDLIIRRCAFHEFFVAHGEPTLTTLFCGWDRIWMDLIDRSSRPLHTERPSTISTGGDCCRFRFVDERLQQPAGSAGERDIVLVGRDQLAASAAKLSAEE